MGRHGQGDGAQTQSPAGHASGACGQGGGPTSAGLRAIAGQGIAAGIAAGHVAGDACQVMVEDGVGGGCPAMVRRKDMLGRNGA